MLYQKIYGVATSRKLRDILWRMYTSIRITRVQCLLENNGAQSIGKGSRHKEIKYFFITDKVKNKEVKVMYCPTKQMVADFFTKPLQGILYFTHINAVLGINEEDMTLYIKAYELHRQSMMSIVKP